MQQTKLTGEKWKQKKKNLTSLNTHLNSEVNLTQEIMFKVKKIKKKSQKLKFLFLGALDRFFGLKLLQAPTARQTEVQ